MTAHRRPYPFRLAALALLALFAAAVAPAQTETDEGTNALERVDHSVLPGNRLELRFQFAQPVAEPRSFTIREPARIALDFPGTRNATGERQVPIDVGVAESINIAEAQGRTRVVVNLAEVPEHSTRVEGNAVVVTLGGDTETADTDTATAARTAPGEPFAGEEQDAPARDRRALEDIDFRRGEEGEGRVILQLSDPNIPVNIDREGGNVVVELGGTRVPEEMRERLDVLDFATPVKSIDVLERAGDGRITITPRTQDFDQLAYQSDDVVTVELRPITARDESEADEPEYTGERLSLNFQDIEVRAVLQLLADFTGLNVVVSDSVSGSLTLRLKNVPWDQALDIILRTRGLAKRESGNVVFVAPQQEIAAHEQARLEAERQQEDLAPLRTEYIQVNYAKAGELAGILQSEGTSLLSERASVTVDSRTNTLLIRDTAANLEEARRVVSRLDVPVRQVLIESRIVVATDDFNKELGVAFNVQSDTNPTAQASGDWDVNLPTDATPAGTATLALAELPFGTLLDLEISALQAEGRGEIISSPRVITSNQREAIIEQGVEIPYQEAASSGATSVSFQKAVLSLAVTPQITPDDRIIMDLRVTQDTVGEIFQGVPSIDTRELATQVLIDNGETVVLGGIYEQTQNEQVNRVPFFGDLPIVGRLFKQTNVTNEKSELLVFVTPRIVRGGTDVAE